MNDYLKKVVIKMSFEELVDQLQTELERESVAQCGMADFHRTFMDSINVRFNKYTILTLFIPHLYQRMFMLDLPHGTVLPCHITVIELLPGEIEVVRINPTELLARETKNGVLQNLTKEVSTILDLVIHKTQRNTSNIPDLITSWG